MKELIKIQKELKAPKNQYNAFGKYNYRSCEDILEAVKPLTPDDCVVKVSDEMVCLGEGSSARFYIKATASFRKGEEVEEAHGWARESLSKKGMDESQITGTASSYARKYALNGLFLIDDTKDADTQKPQTSEEDIIIATEKLESSTTLKDLQENFMSLGTLKANEKIIAKKNELKAKLS